MTEYLVPNDDVRRAKRDPGTCSGCTATEASCIGVIRGGAIKCCPDCEHRESVLAAVLPGHDAALRAEWEADAQTRVRIYRNAQAALILALADEVERDCIDGVAGNGYVVDWLRRKADQMGG
jgi:hypothetical protein